MNSEQEKEMINFLSSAVFTGEEFTNKLQDKLKLNLPGFKVDYEIPFGEEKMKYQLHFKKDPQFDAYRLEKYDATLRREISIDEMNINGINTAELEQRMKAVNWKDYFGERTTPSPEKAGLHKELLNDLLQLTAKLHQYGAHIQSQLILKYFPDKALDNAASDLRSSYETGRSFIASEYGICHANLAYHTISGRLGDLHAQLLPLNLDEFTHRDVYWDLERILSGYPDTFKLEYARNEPEGYFGLTIPVIQKYGGYYIDGYEATLTPYPPIEHGVYNGIDTQKLEEQMQAVDWYNDKELFIFHEDREPSLRSHIDEIDLQVSLLQSDPQGREVADKLMVKYWADATLFSDSLPQSAWDYLDQLSGKRQETFPYDMEVKAAYNLLCGRAALAVPLAKAAETSHQWTMLNLDHTDEDGRHPKVQINGFSKSDMENQLLMLPIPNSNYYQVRNGLLRGDLAQATLNNGNQVLIASDPVQRTLQVFTPDMRPIPVNLRLDAEFKIPNENTAGQKQPPGEHKKAAQTFQKSGIKKNNKGKKL